MNDAIADLQERFAHQELAIETLNQVVADQGRLIDALRAELARVSTELRELRPSPLDGDTANEPPPPHY
jgi:SlyX protein